MRVRLRHITTRRSGAKASRDETLDTGRLGIGRATGSDVHLSGLTVALEHAVIERREERTWIQAVGNAEVRVNGHVTTGRVLAAGDAVRIGSHEIRMRAPEGDEELLLEVEQVSAETSSASSLRARSRLRIAEGLPATRSLAWLAALAVLGVCVAAPLALGRFVSSKSGTAGGSLAQEGVGSTAQEGGGSGTQQRGSSATQESGASGARTAAGVGSEERAAAALRALHSAWNPGPLSAGHAHVAERCETCHVETFRTVPDRACLECHPTTAAHVAPAREFAGFDAQRCGSCHADHRGAQALTAFSDAFCARCHADLGAVIADTKLGDATSFDGEHPEFRPSVVSSGLSFPHDKHLVPRLRAPVGEVRLECADCHALEASLAAMRPIVFARDCQRCHSLAFDALHPERQAPHSEPGAVRQGVLEFYATVALTGQARDPQAPAVARRRPGRNLTEPERLEALGWAEASTASALDALVGENGPCGACHALSQVDGATAVAPVRVIPFEGAARWLPLAKFSHDSHDALACERCHAARSATTSEAVLLPAIGVCRDCHGGDRAAHGRVSSPCLLCHDFHHAELGPMRAQAEPGVEAGAARAQQSVEAAVHAETAE